MADQTSRFGLNMPAEDEYVNASRALYNNNFEAIDALLGAPARETAPLNPGAGQIYSVPSTKRLKIYLNGVWEDIRVVGDVLSSAEIPNLNASKITGGTLDADRIPNLNASKITAGTLNTARIPNLPASKITSGTLNINRIPAIPVSWVNNGTWSGVVDNGSGSNRVRVTSGMVFTGSTALYQNTLDMGNVSYRRDGSNAEIMASGSVHLAAGGGSGLVTIQSNGRIQSEGTYNSTTSSSSNVFITSEGRFSRSTSSRRYKDDIQDAPTLDRVLDIRPRTWVSKNLDDGTERHYGVISEELADLGLEYLITRNEDGQPEGVNYDRIAVALIPIIRELDDRLKRVEEAIEKMYDYDY